MAQEFLNYTDPTLTYDDYISGAATLSAAYPVTMNVWFYPPSASVTGFVNVVGVGNGSDVSHHRLRINNTTIRVSAVTVDTVASTTAVAATTNYTASAWNMATYVCTSATSRTVYVNAGSSGTTTVSRTVTAPTNWSIGGYYQLAPIPNYEGYLAEFSVWDAALTADEITSLYRGTKADGIRPQNLKVYVPLVRNHTDTRGLTTSITSNFPSGATVKDHVRRYG
jgi:hypothetical protein